MRVIKFKPRQNHAEIRSTLTVISDHYANVYRCLKESLIVRLNPFEEQHPEIDNIDFDNNGVNWVNYIEVQHFEPPRISLRSLIHYTEIFSKNCILQMDILGKRIRTLRKRGNSAITYIELCRNEILSEEILYERIKIRKYFKELLSHLYHNLNESYGYLETNFRAGENNNNYYHDIYELEQEEQQQQLLDQIAEEMDEQVEEILNPPFGPERPPRPVYHELLLEGAMNENANIVENVDELPQFLNDDNAIIPPNAFNEDYILRNLRELKRSTLWFRRLSLFHNIFLNDNISNFINYYSGNNQFDNFHDYYKMAYLWEKWYIHKYFQGKLRKHVNKLFHNDYFDDLCYYIIFNGNRMNRKEEKDFILELFTDFFNLFFPDILEADQSWNYLSDERSRYERWLTYERLGEHATPDEREAIRQEISHTVDRLLEGREGVNQEEIDTSLLFPKGNDNYYYSTSYENLPYLFIFYIESLVAPENLYVRELLNNIKLNINYIYGVYDICLSNYFPSNNNERGFLGDNSVTVNISAMQSIVQHRIRTVAPNNIHNVYDIIEEDLVSHGLKWFPVKSVSVWRLYLDDDFIEDPNFNGRDYYHVFLGLNPQYYSNLNQPLHPFLPLPSVNDLIPLETDTATDNVTEISNRNIQLLDNTLESLRNKPIFEINLSVEEENFLSERVDIYREYAEAFATNPNVFILKVREWIKYFYITNCKSLQLFYDFPRYKRYYQEWYPDNANIFTERGRVFVMKLIDKRICKEINQREKIIDFGKVNLLQAQDEINSIKWSLGKYMKLFIYVYTGDYRELLDQMFFERQRGLRIPGTGLRDNLAHRILFPLNRVPDNFLTTHINDEDNINEFFEMYHDLKNNNSRILAHFSPLTVSRIEINLESANLLKVGTADDLNQAVDDDYVDYDLEGGFIPIKLKCYNEIIRGISALAQMDGSKPIMNCFLNSIQMFVPEIITEEEFTLMQCNYAFKSVSRLKVKQCALEFDICIRLRVIKIKGRVWSREYYYGDRNKREVYLALILFGSYAHYIPNMIITEMTRFCCEKLNIEHEYNYLIREIKSGRNRILHNGDLETYKKGKTYAQLKDTQCKVRLSDIICRFLREGRFEWLSQAECEELRMFTGKIEINLEKSYRIKEKLTLPVIKGNDNKKIKVTNIKAADTETYVDEHGNLIPYCICYYNGEKYYNFYGTSCQYQFLDVIITEERKVVYFHNLKFDGWLFKNFAIRNMIYHGGMLYSLTLLYKDEFIELRDSLCLINTKLKNFPKMFGFVEEKELFPYNLINEQTIQSGFICIQDCKKEFTNDEYNKFEQLCRLQNFLIGNKINVKLLTTYYCKRDVLVLYKGLKSFQDMCLKVFGITPLRFITISSFSYEVLVRNAIEGLNSYKGDIKGFIRNCIRGGRCMLSENKKVTVQQPVVDFDACSLYPSAMSRLLLPTGEIFYSNKSNEIEDLFINHLMKEQQLIKDCQRYVSAMILRVKVLSVGVKRKFPLLSFKENGINNYINEMEGKEIYLTHIELEDFIKYQDGRVEYLEVLYWKGNRDSRLSEYIKEVYDLRKKYKEEKNNLQEVIKLFMNSAYGKTIQKDIEEDNLLECPSRLQGTLNNRYWRVRSVIEINDQTVWVKLDSDQEPMCVPCQVGALILGMSKRIMNEVICTAEDNDISVFYQDTDSIHMLKGDVEKLRNCFYTRYKRELIGGDMGQFHIDFPLINGKDTWSRRSIFLGKKCYLDCLVNSEGKEQYFTRMKGIPESTIKLSAEEFGISIEKMYEVLYEGEEFNFNLLKGDNPRFEFMSTFGIKLREKFNRTVKF